MLLQYIWEETINVSTVEGKKEIKKWDKFETKKDKELLRNYKNLFKVVDPNTKTEKKSDSKKEKDETKED